MLYELLNLIFFKHLLRQPTFFEIDISLSFNTIITFDFSVSILFNASRARPPVKAPSPIMAMTSFFSLFKSLV